MVARLILVLGDQLSWAQALERLATQLLPGFGGCQGAMLQDNPYVHYFCRFPLFEH